MTPEQRAELEADPAIQVAMALGYPLETLGPPDARQMTPALRDAGEQADARRGRIPDAELDAAIREWSDIQEKLTAAADAWGEHSRPPGAQGE